MHGLIKNLLFLLKEVCQRNLTRKNCTTVTCIGHLTKKNQNFWHCCIDKTCLINFFRCSYFSGFYLIWLCLQKKIPQAGFVILPNQFWFIRQNWQRQIKKSLFFTIGNWPDWQNLTQKFFYRVDLVP